MDARSIAERCPVTLSLRQDLLQRATAVTHDLSETVEELLTRFVNREEARRRDQTKLDEVIESLNALHARDGLLSDEFPSF